MKESVDLVKNNFGSDKTKSTLYIINSTKY